MLFYTRVILALFLTFFASMSNAMTCDFSSLSPENILEIAALPKDEALARLKFLCDSVRAEFDRLEGLSATDPLTQLSNRRGVMNRLQGRTQNSRGSTFVAMIDIDHFKRVNDTFGHDFGDEVIRQVAKELNEIIKGSLRAEDIAGRWGGEEFVIIFDAPDSIAAMRAMRRLRMNVKSHTFKARDTSGAEHFFIKTISVGLAEFYSDSDTFEMAQKRADLALYEAKKTRDAMAFVPRPINCDGVLSLPQDLNSVFQLPSDFAD